MTDNVKAIAHLRSGGTVDITLPLIHCRRLRKLYSVADDIENTWREDVNGVMINLEQVQAITFAPAKVPDHRVGQELVALIDREDDRWVPDGEDHFALERYKRDPDRARWKRDSIELHYGPVREVWE